MYRVFELPSPSEIEEELGVPVVVPDGADVGVRSFRLEGAGGASVVVTFDGPGRSVRVVVDIGEVGMMTVFREGAVRLSVDASIVGCQIDFETDDTSGVLLLRTYPHIELRETVLLA